MGTKTGIAWTESTWNPIRGCTLVSAGCKNCYAMKVAHRYSGPGMPYEGLTDNGKWNGTIRVVPEHMDQPLRWGTQRRIFVNSMSDLFHSNVERRDLDEIFSVMAMSTHHRFQVLTKRPQNMVNYFKEGARERIAEAVIYHWGLKYMRTGPFAKDAEGHRLSTPTATGVAEGIRNGWRWPLPNVWLGVSVEDQETADYRIPLLLQTPAAVRFVSYEPALAGVDFRAYLGGHHEPGRDGVPCARGNRHVHDGRGRAHLASQGVDEGQPERLGASTCPGRDATRGREHVGAAPGVHSDDVPARDVRRKGRAVDGPRAPSDLDDVERPDDRARAGDQPQERQRPRQQAEQLGGRHDVAERDARDPRAGREAEVFAGREERCGEVDGRAGRGDPSARGAQVDAAVEDRGDVQRRPADGVEHRDGTHMEARRGLSWVIIGGESGPGARPFDVSWARSTVTQCREAGTSCFVKQFGAKSFDGEEPDHDPNGADKPRWLYLNDRAGADPAEWPEDLRVREYPKGV